MCNCSNQPQTQTIKFRGQAKPESVPDSVEAATLAFKADSSVYGNFYFITTNKIGVSRMIFHCVRHNLLFGQEIFLSVFNAKTYLL